MKLKQVGQLVTFFDISNERHCLPAQAEAEILALHFHYKRTERSNWQTQNQVIWNDTEDVVNSLQVGLRRGRIVGQRTVSLWVSQTKHETLLVFFLVCSNVSLPSPTPALLPSPILLLVMLMSVHSAHSSLFNIIIINCHRNSGDYFTFTHGGKNWLTPCA